MKNAKYWKSRFEILEESKTKIGQQAIKDIEASFRNAQRDIEDQISTWYQRFADNNQISLHEARKLLISKELAEFKWDVNEYIKHGQENAVSQRWMKELENASARIHISRLEALKLQTQNTLEHLFTNQVDSAKSLMKQQYLDGYNHTFYEIQKGFNVGWDIAGVNENLLDKILSKPWTADDRTFSDRIWEDKDRLLNRVQTDLTRNMILGKPPDAAIEKFASELNTSKHNAGRLIMTESAYFSNLAQRDAFKTLDVERIEVVETLDAKTCEICGAMDGQVVSMSDYQAGVTAPPFHPWCRGCTVPYFDDDFGERIARDEKTGESFYVPSDMKYMEWKAAYVDKTQPKRTTPVTTPTYFATMRNYTGAFAQKMGKSHYDAMQDLVDGCGNPDLQKVWNHYESQINFADTNYQGGAHCTGNNVYLDIVANSQGSSYKAPYETTFHESAHAIDHLASHVGSSSGQYNFSSNYKNGIFPDTIKQEIDGWANSVMTDMKAHKDDFRYFQSRGWIDQATADYCIKNNIKLTIDKDLAHKAMVIELLPLGERAIASISDMMDGATNHNYNCGFGHKPGYWTNNTSLSGIEHGRATEAFAGMTSAVMASPESVATIKKYLPNSYAVYEEMIKYIANNI